MTDEEKKTANHAYIDGQNLYMGTAKREEWPWRIDLKRFRVYLNRKYGVVQAYYFLGYVHDEHQDLYDEIQKAGFILHFRKHNPAMLGKKKGNVDSDIIFHIMKKMYKREDIGKIVLVSGDGDYKMLVDFLIEERSFEKILFPNRQYRSSLYMRLSNKFFAYLDDVSIQEKIGEKRN